MTWFLRLVSKATFYLLRGRCANQGAGATNVENIGRVFNPYNVSAMLRSYAFAVVALVAVAMAQDRPTFRTDVSQVHVDAEVLTEEGRIVAGLSRGDFRVFDEAQEQAIVGFAGEEQPLQLILLFDVSGSMRTQVMKVSAAAAKRCMIYARVTAFR